MAKRRKRPLRKIYSPAVWPTWAIVGVGWLLARLPMSALRALGNGVGSMLYRTASSRREIARINLQRCFPNLDEIEQNRLVHANLQQISVGILEMMVAWLNPGRDLRKRFTVSGEAHLQAALDQGRGVLLLGGHFATMDIISQPLMDLGNIDVMYRFNKNPVWEWLQVRGRGQYFEGVIERQDIRGVLRRLKAGRAVWYAPDQDYGAKHSVFAPFFGVNAATIVATSRFARLNDSPTLLMTQFRDRETMRWHIKFSPIITDFPSDDDYRDAARLNGLLEEAIRQAPDQYLWIHKRFKTRPPGEPSFYQQLQR